MARSARGEGKYIIVKRRSGGKKDEPYRRYYSTDAEMLEIIQRLYGVDRSRAVDMASSMKGQGGGSSSSPSAKRTTMEDKIQEIKDRQKTVGSSEPDAVPKKKKKSRKTTAK